MNKFNTRVSLETRASDSCCFFFFSFFISSPPSPHSLSFHSFCPFSYTSWPFYEAQTAILAGTAFEIDPKACSLPIEPYTNRKKEGVRKIISGSGSEGGNSCRFNASNEC